MLFPPAEKTLESGFLHGEMLDMIADGFSAGLMIYDADDKILYASRKIHQMLNIPADCLDMGASLRTIFGAYYDSRKAADNAFPYNKCDTSRSDWIAENLAAHWKERSETVDRLPGYRWLRFSRRRMAGGIGLCLISDVSEQKRSERQWRVDIERVQVIEEILDRLHFPITVTDQNHTYVGANKAACQFMQKGIDAVVGKQVTDVYVPDLAQRILHDNTTVLQTGEPVSVPERIPSPSGEEQLFVTHKMRVGKPGMYFVLTCMEDVTSFATRTSEGGLLTPGLDHINFLRSPANAGLKSETSAIKAAPKILLICRSEALARHAKRRLILCGMEADYLLSEAQVTAFLEMNTPAMPLDIIFVSEEFGSEVLGAFSEAGYRVERISMREIEQSATDVACATLNVRCALWRDGDSAQFRQKDCSRCSANISIQEQVEILVAEDNPINQLVFSQILDSLKLKYRICANAADLIAQLKIVHPKIVFLDTTMPDMDAFAAALSIRANEAASSRRPVPIIGVVALAFEGDREKCLASGMDDMLLKPMSPDVIEATIRNHTDIYASEKLMREIS